MASNDVYPYDFTYINIAKSFDGNKSQNILVSNLMMKSIHYLTLNLQCSIYIPLLSDTNDILIIK